MRIGRSRNQISYLPLNACTVDNKLLSLKRGQHCIVAFKANDFELHPRYSIYFVSQYTMIAKVLKDRVKPSILWDFSRENTDQVEWGHVLLANAQR